MKTIQQQILFIITMFIASTLSASVIFEIDESGSSVDTTITGQYFSPNLTTSLAFDSLDLSQELNVGDSWTFDFFDITVSGFGAATFDIDATLAFSSPYSSGSSSGDGAFFTYFGWISGGKLSWDTQSSDITTAEGIVYNLSFEEGTAVGFGNTATIAATVTLLENPTSNVPEPGTLALLSIGLIGLGAARRRTA